MVVRDDGREAEKLRGAVVAIGNFDGVHRGHRSVIEFAMKRAAAAGRPSAVLTLEPHPRSYFRPDEKLFRLTGDELPYTSTVVIDRFEEEPPQKKGHKRLVKIAATIVVERDGHKAMVIGDKGERIKRIGTETRQELEKLMDAKVFIELWVKVRSGWADDEARVKSFGYE